MKKNVNQKIKNLQSIHFRNAEPAQYFKKNNRRFEFSPVLVAQRLLSDLRIIYNPDTGFYIWNNYAWEEISPNQLELCCIHLLGIESTKSRIKETMKALQVICSIAKRKTKKQSTAVSNLLRKICNLNISEVYIFNIGSESRTGSVANGNCFKSDF